jgi:hypothetical protein
VWYCATQASLGSQTFQTRMRWLPLTNLTVCPLNNAHFVFTVARPIPDLSLTLTLYISPTNK